MKIIISIFTAVLLTFNLQASDTLRIANYNVRIDADGGTKAWVNRKQYVADIIKNKHDFDLFGVQELKDADQESELMAYLTEYTRFSKGRNNTAGTAGERLAIVYKTARFDRIKSGFFFLSETPDAASIGWDAKLNRICLWAKMRDKLNNQEFYFFCGHFDHVGVIARRESANLVLRKIEEMNGVDKLPVFFVGDLNCQPDKIPILNLIGGGLIDSRTLPAAANITGPVGTTNAWDKDPSVLDNRIDYVFVNEQVNILSYKTITNKYTDVYPSDHFPVLVQALITNAPSGLRPVISSSGVKVSILDKKNIVLRSEIPFTYETFNSIGIRIAAQESSLSGERMISMNDKGKGIYLVRTTTEKGKSIAKLILQ